MHPDCPYQKDLVAQFIKSFKSRGLKVGLYYCWRHPGFDTAKNKGKFKVLPPECDPATHTLEQQIEFQKAQIAELLTKYPDVFYIWNDGLDPEIMAADEALARSLGGLIVHALGKTLAPKAVLFVPDLPKTRNAKVMRRIIRSAYLGKDPGDTSSLVNPEAVEVIRRQGNAG